MYQKKNYYLLKIIYLLVLLYRQPNILLLTLFCVCFTMFSPQKEKKNPPTNGLSVDEIINPL
jgi:hypothetical protein